MKSKSPTYKVILASTSPYRKMLLQRLAIDFTCQAPHLDETPSPGESAAHLTQRLAFGKANSVACLQPEALVIGCDQVAEFDGHIVGKPADRKAAMAQLVAFSGRTVEFLSALCVMRLETGFCEEATVATRVHFREYTEAEAGRYIELDQPLDCAGSFKSEAAGSMLLRALESSDPTALIGLPLIRLCHILRKAGCTLP